MGVKKVLLLVITPKKQAGLRIPTEAGKKPFVVIRNL
jgi:hypothetical protein